MSPSPEEPVSETGAGGADAGFVVSDEVRAVAAVDDAGSLISDEVRALGAGADRGGVSVPIAGVSLSVGDDAFQCRLPAFRYRSVMTSLAHSLMVFAARAFAIAAMSRNSARERLCRWSPPASRPMRCSCRHRAAR